ncbi:histidine ammonia-lyase [candidate division KSB1 bacterium]|nr:histidine ammonia-lyase [candidate division KSB1 bacterium]
MADVIIDGRSLDLDSIYRVACGGAIVDISRDAIKRMQKSRACVDSLLTGKKHVYGVNTGFGKLSQVFIPKQDLEELQLNLILSHACGAGKDMPIPFVRAAMLLKVNTLCSGFSGTRPEVAQLLVEMLNNGITPCVPEKGSVGASGDLAPLAHMTLVMLGLGEARMGDIKIDGEKALQKAGLSPLTLKAKEGLALINGTQMMTAWGALALFRANRLAKLADISGAITVESLLGTTAAFDPKIQAARGFAHQIKVAENMRALLRESEIVASHKDCDKVQDPYSSRCIPQVHGAVRHALAYVKSVFDTEINACTDNPLVFTDENQVISGGNFHGQPVSLACDVLSIAISQLANISERRLENLMDTVQSGLPPFLATDSGKNSGFMIAQVTAASLVSENKVLCHPASVDSIPTSANQEDYVSMGAHAARKAMEVVENTETVLAIELLAGCQALDFRARLKHGAGTGAVYQTVRGNVETMTKDRLLHHDITRIKQLFENDTIIETVERTVGEL